MKFFIQRYAKNSSGQVGVIPENYVQAVADPPEPNEPPPPLSTFSSPYPNLDGFNSNNNGPRTSYPPPYDQHQYMNPATYNNNTNNWQTQSHETSAWPSSPQNNVRYIYLFILFFQCILVNKNSSSLLIS